MGYNEKSVEKIIKNYEVSEGHKFAKSKKERLKKLYLDFFENYNKASISEKRRIEENLQKELGDMLYFSWKWNKHRYAENLHLLNYLKD